MRALTGAKWAVVSALLLALAASAGEAASKPRNVLILPYAPVDLGRDELTHRVRKAQRHVVHAGLLAVHDTEAVGDEAVRQLRQSVGERAAHVVVLAGLPGVEAHVLQHGDVTVLQSIDRLLGRRPDRVRGEGDVLAEQLAEAPRDRLQRVARLGLALRSAEVGDHDDPGTGVGELLDRGHAGAHPTVVGDRGAVERDVEVRADQDPSSAELAQGLEAGRHGQSELPTSAVRSISRLE